MDLDFDGVFRFSNPTDEDFVALWNNKEYVFPAMMTVKLVIPDETLEHVQEIRKKFAFKLATREFYKGKVYDQMKNMGNGLPPTFDEKLLQPFIDQCLAPLPEGKIKINPVVSREEERFKKGGYFSSKVIQDGEVPAQVFEEETRHVQPLGKMSE